MKERNLRNLGRAGGLEEVLRERGRGRERERDRDRDRVSSMTVTKLINLCRRAYRLNIHGLVNPTHTPFINAALQN